MPCRRQSFRHSGLPVEIGRSSGELKKLWEQGGEMMTRASLINLAVYSEAPDSLSREHADCRAHHGGSRLPRDRHRRRSRGRRGSTSRPGSARIVTSAARAANRFARSKSLFARAGFVRQPPAEHRLFASRFRPAASTFGGRAIFTIRWIRNSGAGSIASFTTASNGRILTRKCGSSKEAHAEASQRIVFVRLELDPPRPPSARRSRNFSIRRQCRNCSPKSTGSRSDLRRFRSTAFLLVGWLAAQLGWMLVEAADESTIGFYDCAGETIRVSLEEKAGEPVSRCSLFCNEAEFRVVDLPMRICSSCRCRPAADAHASADAGGPE